MTRQALVRSEIRSSPRRGIEELYFEPSADQADVKPPPQIVKVPHEVEIPVDLVIIGLVVVVFVVRALRRARRRPGHT